MKDEINDDLTFEKWFEEYFGIPLFSEKGASEINCTAESFEKCWNTAQKNKSIIESRNQSESSP